MRRSGSRSLRNPKSGWISCKVKYVFLNVNVFFRYKLLFNLKVLLKGKSFFFIAVGFLKVHTQKVHSMIGMFTQINGIFILLDHVNYFYINESIFFSRLGAFKDWDIYEKKRVDIMEPLEQLEEQFKTYKKVFDPKKGSEWLDRKKKKAMGFSEAVTETYAAIKASFANIVALAGEEKRDFMVKEVNEIDERSLVVKKVRN